MGKTSTLKSLINQERRRSTTHYLHFYGVDGSVGSKRLARFARQVEKECLGDKRVFVALDDVPAGDDAAVDRTVAAISRMIGSGAVVAVSLLPEDVLLAERLPDAMRVESSDLLVSDVLQLVPSDSLYDVRLLTGAIPALVSALARDNGSSSSHAVLAGSSYFEALEHLVGTTLRPGLLDEEISIRLAMLLLGRGTFGEVASVTCVNPEEVAFGLERYAPIFGVCRRDGSFRCFGVDSLAGIAACSSILSTKVPAWPSIFDSAARMLVDRGEFGRAAAIARMSSSNASATIVIDHAEDFLHAGEGGLVRKTLRSAVAQSLVSHERAACLETVLLALGDANSKRPERRTLPRGEDGSPLPGIKDADYLLAGCRAVLAGENVSAPVDESRRAEGLAVHLQAVQLLRDGNPSAAQRLVGAHVYSSQEGTLTSALLQLDMSITCALLGDTGAAEDGPCSVAQDLLSRDGFAAIRDEGTFLMALDAILHGTCDLASIDAMVRESERAGNELVRVAALMAGAAVEYMAGDFRSAGLRSATAASAAGRAGFSHLEAEAGILCRAAMGSGMGSGVVPPEGGEAYDMEGLSAVARLVHAALEGEEVSLDVQRALSDLVFPTDETWLLKVLVSGEGAIRGRLGKLIPHAWSAALTPIPSKRRASVVVLPTGGPAEHVGGGGGRAVTPGPRIKLDLLGGISLAVDGEAIPDWRLDRRCAKAMLVFVVLHPRLSVRRYEIIDQIWPDCDYKAGLDRIYQATSALRKVVAEVAPGLDPFLACREDKSVSLDSGLFGCDVDKFEDTAREALAAEGDDSCVLEAVLRAERLYAGDLFVPTRDFLGYVVARRQELRNLYADAMVAGAEAALRLGRFRISARLADSATAVDDLREDAVEVLVKALRSSGRLFEAEQRYKKFAVHFVDRTHMPPSKRIRKAMNEGGRGGGSDQIGRIDNEPMAS